VRTSSYMLNHSDRRKCSTIRTAASANIKLQCVLSSNVQHDWRAFAKFVARVRQSRRQSKLKFEKLAQRMIDSEFKSQADHWRSLGRWVCRHGVFWLRAQRNKCQCMNLADSADHWTHARLMGAIDLELRALVAVPFDAANFRRIGELRAELRRQCL